VGGVMDELRRRLCLWAAAMPVATSLASPVVQARAAGDPGAVVDRWFAAITGKSPSADLGQVFSPDAVVVLHGLGENEDGTPRRIEGLGAIRAWVEKLQARQAEPPNLRVDDRLVDGNKVAFRGRNVWVLRDGSGAKKVAQSLAAFYYVESDRIVLIERYVGGIRPKVG
jgi:ketosteroid isomerase-like protein